MLGLYEKCTMGSLLACCYRQRYRKVAEDIVLETNENESKGIYWFRDLPKATITRGHRAEQKQGYQVLKRIHRFSAMIESKVGDAVAIIPKAPEWRVMYEEKTTGFKMCELRQFLFFSRKSTFLLISVSPGQLRGRGNKDIGRVGTLEVEYLYAEEIARAFWDPNPNLKKGWDPTIEKFEHIENLAELAYVGHLVFQNFWPATQR